MQAAPSNNAEGIDGPSHSPNWPESHRSARCRRSSIPSRTADTRSKESAQLLTARLADAWNTGQDHWVSLSSLQGELVEVADSGHYIHISPAQPRHRADRILARLTRPTTTSNNQ